MELSLFYLAGETMEGGKKGGGQAGRKEGGEGRGLISRIFWLVKIWISCRCCCCEGRGAGLRNKEREGEERKGKERKGKGRRGKERQGKERRMR